MMTVLLCAHVQNGVRGCFVETSVFLHLPRPENCKRESKRFTYGHLGTGLICGGTSYTGRTVNVTSFESGGSLPAGVP